MSFYNILKWYKNYPWYLKDFWYFRKQAKEKNHPLVKISDSFPCLTDKTSTTSFEPHYTYHPAWAARIVAAIKPKKHIDISSVLHFSTLVSAFVPTEFYDYRPAHISLDNLVMGKADLVALPFDNNSVESISCMHTIEHVGLGRYGDPLDVDGDKKAAKELARVVAPGGTFIFVAPVGKPRIEFNAHRIYSYEQVLELFPSLTLKEFSLVSDNFKETGLIKNAPKEIVANQEWACGCFWFIKK